MAGISPSTNSTDMRNNGSALHFTKIQNEKNTSFHKLAYHELDKILVENFLHWRKALPNSACPSQMLFSPTIETLGIL